MSGAKNRFDVTYTFHTDTPPGKDPDLVSPTLRLFHQALWSKPLPCGEEFTLHIDRARYLVHESSLGTFQVSSDAIATRFGPRTRALLDDVPADQRPSRPGYLIGASIVFPGNTVDRKMTINGARGFHPLIADRFDLTLECIRRFYAHEPSPLGETLTRYADFFTLFEDFSGYTDFFLLQDLVDDGAVRFLHHFDGFATRQVPSTTADYLSYLTAVGELIRLRTARIDRWLNHE